MSRTFSLVCHETKQKVWVGQGCGLMDSFYSGEPETMKQLGDFLKTHEAKPLFLLCNDHHDEIIDYAQYGEIDTTPSYRPPESPSRSGTRGLGRSANE